MDKNNERHIELNGTYKFGVEKLYNTYQEKVKSHAESLDLSSIVTPEIKVITSEEGFDKLKDVWANLVDVAESTVFQTYEWNRTWWKYYGERGQLHLVAFYTGKKLVGIAPLFRDSIKFFGKQGYLCFRFIGSDVSQPPGGDLLGLISYTDYLDFIIRPGFEDPVYSSLLKYFLTCDCTYDEIILDVVPQHSTMWEHFLPKLELYGLQFLIEEQPTSQIIKLRDSWNNYLAKLSKNRRSHIRRSLKKVYNSKKKIFDEFEVTKEEDVLPFFEKLVRLHQTRWNRVGSLGTFAEKKNYAFHKEISMTFFKKGWLQLKVLQPIDHTEDLVAVDLNYRFKNRHYGIHSSVNMDSKYYSEGPGSVLLNLTLKNVAESSYLDFYDFLRGSEDYKIRLSNQTSRNRRIVITNIDREGKVTPQLVKRYAYYKRRLYREFRQLSLFFEPRSFFKAISGYTHFLLNRVKTKF
jgi:CelD/BcsL family acetyltransferase involved in cellulose biosynthesis